MRYLVTERNKWRGKPYLQVTDNEDNEVFRIAPADTRTIALGATQTLQDTSGNLLTFQRKIWNDTHEIVREGKVIATVRSVRRGRGNPQYVILLATGEQLMASRSLAARKFDVRSAKGQPFCRLEHRWFRYARNVEVAEGAELVLAFSLIACFIEIAELLESV